MQRAARFGSATRRMLLALLPLCLGACALLRPRTESAAVVNAVRNEHEAVPTDQAAGRVALVIGNQAYAVAPLTNPVNDANAIAEKLRGLHFDVVLLTDASLEAMKRAVIEFGRTLRTSRGTGVFYFSGHGLQVAGQNFLVPVEATLEDEAYVELETLSADYVLAAMAAADNGVNLLFLDACRNNPFKRSYKSGGDRGLAFMNAPTGTLIAYATSPGEIAGDGQEQYGVYTGSLLSHLADPGLSIEQVLKRTTGEVSERTQGGQIPWYASSLDGDVILNPEKAPDAAELLSLAKTAFAGGDVLGAVDLLEQAKASGEQPLAQAQRLEAEQLLGRARTRVAMLALELAPEDATLRVDGGKRSLTARQLAINPGRHTLSVSRAGYDPRSQSIVVAAGDLLALRVELSEHRVTFGDRLRENWLPAGLFALGGGLLVSSLSTFLAANNVSRRLRSHCGKDKECPRDPDYDFRADSELGQRLLVASDVTLAVGLASVAAGTALLMWGRHLRRQDSTALRADLSCGRNGCSARSTFAF